MLNIRAFLMPAMSFSMISTSPNFSEAQLILRKDVEITDGKCIVIMQSEGEGSVNTVNNMTCPQDASHSYALRYIWLNSTQISLLLSRYVDDNIAPILGSNPNIVLNDVYKNAEYIYRNFGSRIYDLSMDFPDQFFLRGAVSKRRDSDESISFKTAYKDIPVETRRNIYFSQFETNIIWPDDDLIQSILDNRWSLKYNYSYHIPEDENSSYIRSVDRAARLKQAELSDQISQCMHYYRLLSKVEFDQYWDTLGLIEDKIESGQITDWHVDAESADGQGDIIEDLARNPTYDFYKFITRENWPSDFLIVSGKIDNGFSEAGCTGASGGIRNSVDPRSLLMLVAVVTPVNEQITIRSIKTRQDPSTELRSELKFSGSMIESKLSDIILSKENRRSLIIPLDLELNYEKDDYPLNIIETNTDSDNLYKIFQKYPRSPLTLKRCDSESSDQTDTSGELKCNNFMKSSLGDLPQPIGQNVTMKYYYGKAFQIASLEIDGEQVEVRDAPKLELVADLSGGYGSCPFLYFIDEDGSEVFYGRVLVGANSRTLSKSETVSIPEEARKVVIKELEPETTFIKKLSFSNKTGSYLREKTIENFSVSPGKQIMVDIPAGATGMKISGYYRVYSDIATNRISSR